MKVNDLVRAYIKEYWVCIDGLIYTDKAFVPTGLLDKEVEEMGFYNEKGCGKTVYAITKKEFQNE